MSDFRYGMYTIHESEEGPVVVVQGPGVQAMDPAQEAIGAVDGLVCTPLRTVEGAMAWVRERYADYLKQQSSVLYRQALETGEAHSDPFETPSEEDAKEVARYLRTVLDDYASVVALPIPSGWASDLVTTRHTVRVRFYRVEGG